jgi:hypothetical protein
MRPALKSKYDAAKLSRKIYMSQQIAVLVHHCLDPAVVEMKSNPAMMTTSSTFERSGGGGDQPSWR